eukprot:CAMPEP_0173328116 /NCGR_PEP_ID=MMETSP1144-20121109/1983_1 /TAXON_ID=483371 /ORGANISM="non described non described, Strain CCMP2298" /LENGTH=202 /DNA_ID=CAMNT_0014272583 /DNA_START=1057 /DNA_END=1665 /DNA_ORIENTATION=+
MVRDVQIRAWEERPEHRSQVRRAYGLVELQARDVEVLPLGVREHVGEKQGQRELPLLGNGESQAVGEGEHGQPGGGQLEAVVVLCGVPVDSGGFVRQVTEPQAVPAVVHEPHFWRLHRPHHIHLSELLWQRLPQGSGDECQVVYDGVRLQCLVVHPCALYGQKAPAEHGGGGAGGGGDEVVAGGHLFPGARSLHAWSQRICV